MTLDMLKTILLPPTTPVDVPTEAEWVQIEAELGLVLPEDYKQFQTDYGAGCIDNFFWVFNPVIKNPYLNMRMQLRPRLSALRSLRDEYEADVPYSLYPDPGGLLPWGATDNGDVLHWLTRNEGFVVIVQASRSPDWDEFELSTTEFIEKLLSREIVVSMFPDDWPLQTHSFTPPPKL